MKKFKYTALDQNGQEVSGEIEAASESEAITSLRRQSLYPTKVEEVSSGEGAAAAPSEKAPSSGRINLHLQSILDDRAKTRDRRSGWATLGLLVSSGTPILQALKITAESLLLPEHQALFLEIRDVVKEGESMLKALEKHPVPAYEVALVEVGEETGQLPEMLSLLGEMSDVGIPQEDVQFALVNYVSILLDAGLPLTRALVVTADSLKGNPRTAEASAIASSIAEKIQRGSTFSEALKEFPAHIDPACLSLAKAGELGGVLELTMARCRNGMIAEYRRHGFGV